MRKIILDLAVTLDGFIEGTNGEIDWCIMDDDMDFEGFLDTIDTIFYGRVSYDAWGNFKPDQNAAESEKQFWKNIHSKTKYVFSTNVKETNIDAIVISKDLDSRIAEIKNQKGKDIWLYGGASIIKTFIDFNWIDIYRISVHPIALGKGKALFENLSKRLNLSLVKTNVFKSGVVQLIYQSQTIGY